MADRNGPATKKLRPIVDVKGHITHWRSSNTIAIVIEKRSRRVSPPPEIAREFSGSKRLRRKGPEFMHALERRAAKCANAHVVSWARLITSTS